MVSELNFNSHKTAYCHLKSIAKVKRFLLKQDTHSFAVCQIIVKVSLQVSVKKKKKTSTNTRTQVNHCTGTGLFSVPRVRTKKGEAAFSIYAPRLWNKQPAHLRFMQKLSAHLNQDRKHECFLQLSCKFKMFNLLVQLFLKLHFYSFQSVIQCFS